MDVMRAAVARERLGGDVIHLEAGQPATPAPRAVREAASRALLGDTVGYTEALGIRPLREAIAAHHLRTAGVHVDPDRVAVTTGSSTGFILSFLAAFDVGDRVAMASPGYPAYRNILRAFGVEPVLLPTGPAERFQPTVALLDQVQGPLHGLIVASPSNPTGTMVDAEGLGALAAWCRARDVRLISDEIYHGITYGRDAASALAVDPDAVVLCSFSKYFSMTGWRIGWMVLPDDLVRPVERLAQNFFISPPTLSQLGAVHAFDGDDELRGHVARYAANRALLLERLPALGITRFAPPDGAFYLYADVRHLTDDSPAFCAQLLADTGVAITPGVDFDPVDGRHTVRISFAGSRDALDEGLRRLGAWLERGGGRSGDGHDR
ncbi:MAG: pyridoxal phosphate-dependent aminotransferase [Alphaproteobacteria bacterium]|nr:pyridoxal phosphate-dependent aminotransferase [Alphaproteobacteria bacterium]